MRARFKVCLRTKNGGNMSKFEVYLDEMGSYHFRLRARNGQIIAVSQSYKSKEGCLKGIKSVKLNASGARIVILEKELDISEELKTGKETGVSV
jgi:uncharacterized protein YegP (UPF0339 family)